MTVDGKKHVIVQSDKNLMALNVSDGKIQWQIPTVPEKRSYNSATPVLDGLTVIYTGQGNRYQSCKGPKTRRFIYDE